MPSQIGHACPILVPDWPILEWMTRTGESLRSSDVNSTSPGLGSSDLYARDIQETENAMMVAGDQMTEPRRHGRTSKNPRNGALKCKTCVACRRRKVPLTFVPARGSMLNIGPDKM